MNRAIHCYLGPSLPLAIAREILPAATFHPPVAHGDLLGTPYEAGDIALIIDGYFFQRQPVRHKEILELLQRGVAVYGASSMGALRAAEMSTVGMVGAGAVYRAFQDGVIDGDDEVALVHSDDDYRAYTEALVNFRATCIRAMRAGSLDPELADRLIGLAKQLPFRRRTIPEIVGLCCDPSERTGTMIALRSHRIDVKARDSRYLLSLAGSGRLPLAPSVPRGDPVVYALHWRAAHARVPDSEVTEEQAHGVAQILDDSYPAIRQRVLLERFIGDEAMSKLGTKATDRSLLVAAANQARQRGLPFDPGDARFAEVISLTERHSLTEAELCGLVIARTFRLPAGYAPLEPILQALRTANLLQAAATIRARADAFNQRIKERIGPHAIQSLPREAIRDELTGRWATDAAGFPAELARRGFLSFEEALEVARELYLFLQQAGKRSR